MNASAASGSGADTGQPTAGDPPTTGAGSTRRTRGAMPAATRCEAVGSPGTIRGPVPTDPGRKEPPERLRPAPPKRPARRRPPPLVEPPPRPKR